MAGRVQWEAQVDSNVAKLLSETKELRDQLDGIKKGNYEIKLNIDDKKLEKVISNLDKMLESLGKGTGDFKEFENLSKQLNEIVSEVKELNKVFSGINDSGVSNLLSSIQNIDKSLSSLSEHITNVNKDFGSIGKNASDNVGQINEAKKATEGLTEATKELTNAQKNVGNKSNISSGNSIVDSKKELSNIIDISSKFNKSLDTTDKEYEKIKNNILTVVNLYKKMLSVNDDFDRYNEAYSKAYDYVKKIGLEQNVYWNKIWQGVKNGVENDNYDDLINGIYSGSIREDNSITEFNKEVIKLDKILQALYGKSINYKEVFLDIFNKLRDGAYSYDKALNKIQEDMNNKPSDLFNDMLYNEGLYPSQLKSNKPTLTIIEGQNKLQDELDETVVKINNAGKAYDTMAYRGIEAEEAVAKASKNYNGATHWSSDEKIARGYGDIVTSGNISLKNAFEVEGNGAYWDKIQILGDGLEENSKKAIEFATSIDKVYSELSTLLTLNDDFNKFNPGFTLYSSIGEEISKLSEEQKSQDDSEAKITSEKVQRLAKIRDLYADLVTEYDKFSRDISHPYGLKTTDELTKYAQANGYDGVIYKNIIDTKHSPIISGNEYIETSNIIVSFYENQVEYLEKISRKGQEYIRENISNLNISSPIEDTFQGDVKASESATSLGKEADEMKEIAEVTPKATKAKNEFADANERVDKGAKKSSESVGEEAKHLDKIGTKLDKYRKDFNNFSAVPDADHRFASFETQLNDLNVAISKLEAHQDALKDKGFVDEADISETKRLSTEIDNLIEKIKKVPQSKRGYKDVAVSKMAEKIASILEQHPRLAKKAKAEIQDYYNELASGNPTRPLDEILDRVNKIIQGQREAGRTGKGFIDILSDKALYGAAAQLAGYYLSLTDFIRYAQNGIQTIRELDTALTEMRKVSDETVSSLEKFQKASFDLADSIGTTALEVQNSTADFMRLGYTLEEASKLSQDANIYANVGDMNIDEATEHMISSIQAWRSEFDSTTQASMEIIDRYNKIGNEFAITSADIGSAMERTSAALKAGGNTLNESIGLITAGNLIQQDADTTANALKVMSLRIRGSKVELESMGETTDDLADSTSKLREQIKALTGVDIMLDDNTFKSTARIIQEIGAEWSKLTDISQSATLELLAGKTRASTVAGLIENYETIDKVITAAENADGSALAENEKYLESIKGKIASLKNELQSLAYDLIDSGTIKDIIDAGKNIISIINKTTDGVSLLSLAIGGLSSYGLSNLNLD